MDKLFLPGLRGPFPLHTLFFSLLLATPSTRAAICPAACACADMHNLQVDCSGRNLRGPPLTSWSTLTLDLSHNRMGPLLNGSLVQMANLTSLDLSHNGLARLLACTFTGLMALKTVTVSHNKIAVLPDTLFTDNEHVEMIDVSYNELSQVPSGMLAHTAKLKKLDLSHNKLVNPAMGPQFQNVKMLSHLDMSYNRFSILTIDTFQPASQWDQTIRRTLKLAGCGLDTISTGALAKIPNLRGLDLSENPDLSSELPALIAEMETPKALRRLSVSGNNLTTLAPLFVNTTRLSLKFLNASHNFLADVPAGTFSTVRGLRVVDLSHNRLSGQLDAGFSDLVNARVLNVSKNELESFSGTPAVSMNKIQHLDISYNRITSAELGGMNQVVTLRAEHNLLRAVAVPGNTSSLKEFHYQANAVVQFSGFPQRVPSLEHFDLSDNDLQDVGSNLFKGAKFLKMVNLSRNSVSSLSHDAFRPQSALVIDLSHNLLKAIKFSSWVATQKLLLQHNALTDLDVYTFHGMTGLHTLDLSHNSLSSMPGDLFQYLIALDWLDLSHNQMYTFPPKLFRSLEALEVLRFSHNKISSLNATSMLPVFRLKDLSLDHNQLKTINPIVFRDMSRLQRLDLAHNPFACSCSMLAFRDWAGRTTVPIPGLKGDNSSGYKCASPSGRKGLHVTSWDVDKLECDQALLYLIIFGAFALFLVVAGIAGTAVYRVYKGLKARKDKIQQLKLEVEWARASKEKAAEKREEREEKVRRSNGYVSMPRGDSRRAAEQHNYDRVRRDMERGCEPPRVHREPERRGRGGVGGYDDRGPSYDARDDRGRRRAAYEERARGGRAYDPPMVRRDSEWSMDGRPEAWWYRPSYSGQQRFPVVHHNDPMGGYGGHYHTLPVQPRRESAGRPGAEVRFAEVEGAAGDGGARRQSVMGARSHSYQALGGGEGGSRQYERLEHRPSGSRGMRAAASQPYLAHQATSDWL